MFNDQIEDIENLYKRLNSTEVELPMKVTIVELFEEQVKRTPDATAVIYKDQSLSYKELDIRSNQVASILRLKGIGKYNIVGIAVERSFEMIVGIYGILKCGAAYLPISPDYPLKRIEYIAEDSKMSCFLTQQKFLYRFENLSVEIIDLDDPDIYSLSEVNIERTVEATDLIYIIYTSGSTGQPKGVMVEHYSVINRLNWMQKKYPINGDDTILQKTPFVFDVSVWEIFWWAIAGARVCMLEAGYEKFPQSIIDEVNKSKVTTVHFVPSMLNVYLNYLDGSNSSNRLKTLKRVFCSGEELLPSHANKFNRLLGQTYMIDLINLYGPTEATVDVTYYDCPKHTEIKQIPIGKPIDNTKLYILNDNKLQPVGCEGELYIAGYGLSRGYLNRDDLTAEKFVDNPANLDERAYKTGDYVRMLADGNIEYIGRIDNQIKIRGLRIELGEIEAKICEFKNINQCVVVIKNYETMNPSFSAYILASNEIEIEELKKFLKAQLPNYMIPNQYLILDKFPVTENGKTDRNALKENKQR